MDRQPSPIRWSFSCGTWFQTQVRVSFFVPLLVLLICLYLKDLQLGLIFSGVFFFSILLHEFGHIAAARMTGGYGDEILLWPFGGLAFSQPAPGFRSQFLVPAAGPLVNLALCLAALYPVIQRLGWAALDPLHFPLGGLSGRLAGDLLVLVFWANWLLLLINLIPVHPFDGGRMVQAALAVRFDAAVVHDIYLKIGFAVGLIGMIAGLFADISLIVALAAVALLLNVQEFYQTQTEEAYDDSFMGYDFSQGYTSLERSIHDEDQPRRRRPGWLARWREKRRAERERRQQQETAELQRQLDLLLEKIQSSGIESLTDAERRQLDRASALFRDKGKQTETGLPNDQ